MIPVDLNITSIVKSDDDEEKIEFFTVGEYDLTKHGAVIGYEETEGIGYENCRVSVTVNGGSITVERTGPAASALCIEKNVKHHCIYGTPFGDFTMGINTYDIQNTLCEAGGRLWFKYSIDINSDFVSENEMEILVTPSGEEQ
ncbi:MAG: DUF1934 domain-containing protein [Ruminiclostridium sp.]|nr:DUF1934 domain-containing protein [Ruminiclostridium sp.]